MESEMKRIEELEERLAKYPRAGGQRFLIPVLQEIQHLFGYLPESALNQVERHLGVPMAQIYGVATFYAQFHFEPHGRHAVRCCRGTACHVRGAKKVLRAAEKALGICEGETTEDLEFSLETVACLGTCFLAPVAMVDGNYFGRLSPRRIEQILSQYKRG